MHQGVDHPDIKLLVPDRAALGGGKIFTLVKLRQFQPRAVLAVPSAIELHQALTGAVAGRLSGDGQWLQAFTGLTGCFASGGEHTHSFICNTTTCQVLGPELPFAGSNFNLCISFTQRFTSGEEA
eukprot:2677293-Rhodomonas_salina.3